MRDAGGKYIVDGGVLEGTPAYEAGINEGDELVAINGYRFTDRLLRPLRKENGKLKTDYLVDTRPGETVSVSVFRRDTLLTIDVTAATAPHDTFEPEISDDRSSRQYTLRNKVLRG